MIPQSKTYAGLIITYLTSHPRQVILISNMLDDLGIYNQAPATGRRSYTIANQTLRAILRGQEDLKYPIKGAGMKPMEGLEIVHEVPTRRGGRDGVIWHRCSVRYTPPVKQAAPTVVKSPATPTTSEVHVYPADPADLSGLEQHLSEHLAEIHSTLLAVLDEQKTANTYLRHLVESWEPGYTADNKENQQ